MKTILLILCSVLPFTLSAQLTVKAYKTTDEYKNEVVRIEIINTSSYNLKIINSTSVADGTLLYFNSNKKEASRLTYGFVPNRYETNEYKLRYVDIKKGKAAQVDIPFSEIKKSVSTDKIFYLLGYVKYHLFTGNNTNIQPVAIKEVVIEIK